MAPGRILDLLPPSSPPSSTKRRRALILCMPARRGKWEPDAFAAQFNSRGQCASDCRFRDPSLLGFRHGPRYRSVNRCDSWRRTHWLWIPEP